MPVNCANINQIVNYISDLKEIYTCKTFIDFLNTKCFKKFCENWNQLQKFNGNDPFPEGTSWPNKYITCDHAKINSNMIHIKNK